MGVVVKMADNLLTFDFFATVILLVIGIRATIIFLRYRTKYNLATLIVVMIFLVISAVDLFLPENLITRLMDSLDIGTPLRILLIIVFTVLLLAFLFYPDIKRFLISRK